VFGFVWGMRPVEDAGFGLLADTEVGILPAGEKTVGDEFPAVEEEEGRFGPRGILWGMTIRWEGLSK